MQNSPHETGVFKLKLPDNEKNYRIENVDTGAVTIASGQELSQDTGIHIQLQPRQSALLRITVLPKKTNKRKE